MYQNVKHLQKTFLIENDESLFKLLIGNIDRQQ